MCGRYYVDDETAREIEKIIRQVNEKINAEQATKRATEKRARKCSAELNVLCTGRPSHGKTRDIYPSSKATVLINKNNQLQTENYKWGFPNYNSKGVIFNARSETVLEKRTFHDSILNRRCIIPANGFYEWDKSKNKFTFQRKQEQTLLMAGFYKKYDDENCFVILTTNANSSVKDVHDRMPLILDRDEIEPWISPDKEYWESMLRKTPAFLIKFGYQQESLQQFFE